MFVDDIKLAGKTQNINPMWKVLNKEVDLGEPTSILDHVSLGCTQRECEKSKEIVDSYRNVFESRISAGTNDNLPLCRHSDANIYTWFFDMEGHAAVQKLQLHALNHQFKEEELGSVGVLSHVCSQIVLKCL